MSRRLMSIWFCSFSLILTACSQAVMTPTAAESTAVLAPTVIATFVPTDTTEPIPIPPTASPTTEFIYAPDVGEPVYPFSRLRILSPGEGTSQTSPLQPELSVILGTDNTIEVELLNSNSDLLVKKLLNYPEIQAEQRILIRPLLDFEIPAEEESGRLVVKTFDEFNRLVALSSCDLILLASGEVKLEPGAVPYEPFLLTEPHGGAVIHDGVVAVSGYARPVSSSAIILEMVDEKGVGVANRQLVIHPDPAGSPVPFSTTLPYPQGQTMAVRLIIRQSKGLFAGPAITSSLLLTLE